MAHSAFYLLVSGSRHFSDSSLLDFHLSKALVRQPQMILICGEARGCDSLVHQWACEHRVPLLIAPAHWASCGRSAGIIRNDLMLSMAHGVLAFPEANSKGTKYVINQARKMGLPIKVVAS